LDNFNWHKHYIASVEPISEVHPLVKWVAENYELGLLSNTFPGFTEELRQKKMIPDADYTVLVESYKVGAVKPDLKIYEAAQQLASVEPNEILMVDNERPYLTAADRLGWHVVWFDELNPAESVARVKKALEF
jgi:HAD superfamily hydrolase (TIGR01509 family)